MSYTGEFFTYSSGTMELTSVITATPEYRRMTSNTDVKMAAPEREVAEVPDTVSKTYRIVIGDIVKYKWNVEMLYGNLGFDTQTPPVSIVSAVQSEIWADEGTLLAFRATMSEPTAGTNARIYTGKCYILNFTPGADSAASTCSFELVADGEVFKSPPTALGTFA